MSDQNRIFLGHACEDKPKLRELYQRLKVSGFSPWLDSDDLIPGQNWRIEIPEAIKSAAIILACLSKISVAKKGYVQREYRYALSAYADLPPKTIYLIPVRLDDCNVPDLRLSELDLNLRDLHWVDLFEGNGFERISCCSTRGKACHGWTPKKQKEKRMTETSTKSNKMSVAVIPGDGIGHEVVPEGIRVLEAVGRKFDLGYEFTDYDWSCEHYVKTGKMMPKDGIEQIRDSDAIYLGAVGFPGVPDHVSLWGLLIPIRRRFEQYINLRPVRLFKGLESPLAGREPGDIDYWIVRENNEGEYSSIGGRMFEGTELEAAIQQAVFTRKGCDRVMRYAFDLAKSEKRKTVTSATKSNGISISMPYWDERFADISTEYPDIETNQFHIDILCAHLVGKPDTFDVIVGSNLFGDILSDLGPATTGTIGIAPGANINPERDYPSMFEPVHGSAPDIAGKGIANPIGQIWSGAMMLEHLGHPEAAQSIVTAIERVIETRDVLTPDMGGKATTSELGEAIADLI